MLGSLLRQLVSGLEGIPEAVVQSYRNQKKVIGGRRLQVSGILKIFQTITVTKRTFICVDALDECAPEHRVIVLESLRQILQGSPNTRLFMTGRPHIRSEIGRKLDGTADFILIQPTEDGFARYLREKLRNDTTPDIMSATLEADIMKIIPELSSETYVRTWTGAHRLRSRAEAASGRAGQASRTWLARSTTGASELHGKLIQRSVRRQT